MDDVEGCGRCSGMRGRQRGVTYESYESPALESKALTRTPASRGSDDSAKPATVAAGLPRMHLVCWFVLLCGGFGDQYLGESCFVPSI